MPAFARISRAATLALREHTFILAARLSGTTGPRILLRHVSPNIMPQLITFGLLGMGVIIIIEGALSFFGLGVPPPAPSWGNMIADGQGVLSAEPAARADPERGAVHHRAGLQPARRRAARPLERGMSVEDMQSRVVADRGAPAAGPLLEVSDLRVDFRLGGEHVRAVDGLGYTVAAGRHAGDHRRVGLRQDRELARRDGAAAASATVTGSIRFEGSELLGLSDKKLRAHRGSSFAMVFQDPSRSLNPTMRIGKQVTEAVRAHLPLDRAAARERAIELLALVVCRRPSAASRSTRTSSRAGCASAW